jgi:hypothetical protein
MPAAVTPKVDSTKTRKKGKGVIDDIRSGGPEIFRPSGVSAAQDAILPGVLTP